MLQGMFRERRRSLMVRDSGLLDTAAEPIFDRFVNDAAAAFDAPISLLSLIHDQRQWFKARRGVDMDCIERDQGFCTFALDQASVLETCDPRGDIRFATLPVVVGPPHIRYYIGAPLQLLSGIDVGALCVLDTVPRQPASPDQKAYLLALARQAAQALDIRLQLIGDAA